jgi:hypothetical protein
MAIGEVLALIGAKMIGHFVSEPMVDVDQHNQRLFGP